MQKDKVVLELNEDEYISLLTAISLPVEILKRTDEFVGEVLGNASEVLGRIMDEGEEKGFIKFDKEENVEEEEKEE